MALFLGKCRKDSQEHFRIFAISVDAFLLEDEPDAKAAQVLHVVHRIDGIAGKAGDGLTDDHIDQSILAVFDHPQKLWSPLRLRT